MEEGGGAGSGGRVGQKLISRGDKYNDASKGRKTKTRKKIEINRRMQKKGEEIAKKKMCCIFLKRINLKPIYVQKWRDENHFPSPMRNPNIFFCE